jgi:dihydrofolate synthase/folylpolyglutamate synthase
MVIFDGGHNPQGVVSAVNSIKQYLGEERVYTVTGVMADKDYSFIASEIAKVSERVFCLTPDNSRALDSEEYAAVYRNLGIEAEGFKSIDNAIFNAVEMARKNDKKILCLGSLYMYADVIRAIENLQER